MYPTDNQIKSFKSGDNVFIREPKIKLSPRYGTNLITIVKL